MLRSLWLAIVFSLAVLPATAQKPKSGTYTFAIAYWEWGSKPRNNTCTVVIKGDSVTLVSNGHGYSGDSGNAIDRGIIMLHKKSGKWIIGHNAKAKYAPRVGGCEEGPTVIDFKRRRVWLC